MTSPMSCPSTRPTGILQRRPPALARMCGLLIALSSIVACGPGGPATEIRSVSTGETVGDFLGVSVAAAADLDGDGYADLLAGASQYATQTPEPGFVLALSGKDGSLLYTLRGASSGDGFGTTVSSVGDVDGDGIADIAVGAPSSDAGRPDAGTVALFSGRAGTPLWSAHGARGGDGLGVALATLGDVDGDGIPDVAASALQPAMSPDHDSGPGYIAALSGATGETLFKASGDDATLDLGRQLAPLGDLNGDGLPDLAASAPSSQVVVYLSGRTGSVLHRMEDLGAGFGGALAPAGDVNGDGLPDLLVGAPLDSRGAALAGAVHVLSGADGTPLLIARGTEGGLRLGGAVASVADLDGDGVPDIAAASASGGSLRILSGADGHELRRVDPSPEQFDFGFSLAALGDPAGPLPAVLGVGFPGNGPMRNSTGGVLIVALRR